MPALTLAELIPILQVAIGPVVLVSGVGLLLLTMTNRLGRVIDRSRLLVREYDAATPGSRRTISLELRILMRRGRLIRAAILAAALCALWAAALVITLFVVALTNLNGVLLIVALFVLSVLCLIASLILFVLDINASLTAMELEVDLPARDG